MSVTLTLTLTLGVDPADPLISPLHAELAELAAALPRTFVTFGTGEQLLAPWLDLI